MGVGEVELGIGEVAMTPLTGEDAYWHACSNTPIDGPDAWSREVPVPDAIFSDVDYGMDRYVYTFTDGIRVRLDREIVRALAVGAEEVGRPALRELLRREYIARTIFYVDEVLIVHIWISPEQSLTLPSGAAALAHEVLHGALAVWERIGAKAPTPRQ